jgi:hypothetical protein
MSVDGETALRCADTAAPHDVEDAPPEPALKPASAPPAGAGAVCESAVAGFVRVNIDGDAADEWACVVCLETLTRAEEADAPSAQSLRGDVYAPFPWLFSALPADLPCGHGCCAACLTSYLRTAVPRAARATLGDAPLRVLCPGVIAHEEAAAVAAATAAPAVSASRLLPGGAGAWDLRCHTALPDSLLAPFWPPAPSSAAPRAEDALPGGAARPRTPSTVQQLLDNGRSELYLRLRTRPCPWCGARSEKAGGCNTMRCAACTRLWCYACGARDPRACLCSEEDGGPLADAMRWARASHSAATLLLRWPPVLLFLALSPAAYFILLIFLAAETLNSRLRDAHQARTHGMRAMRKCCFVSARAQKCSHTRSASLLQPPRVRVPLVAAALLLLPLWAAPLAVTTAILIGTDVYLGLC